MAKFNLKSIDSSADKLRDEIDDLIDNPETTKFYVNGVEMTFAVPRLTAEAAFLSEFIDPKSPKKPDLVFYCFKDFNFTSQVNPAKASTSTPQIPVVNTANIKKTLATIHTIVTSPNLNSILTVDIPIVLLSAFCYAVIAKNEKEDWTSMGIMLAKKDGYLSPKDLVTPIVQEINIPATITAPSGSELSDPNMSKLMISLAFLFTAPYRIFKNAQTAKDDTLLNKLQDKLNGMYSLGSSKYNIANIKALSIGWIRSKKYTKLCALIDMFLYRMKGLKESILRLTTTKARYKDSDALILFGEYVNICGSLGRASVYSYDYNVNKEIIYIQSKDHAELIVEGSYLPYLTSLISSEANPYSAKKNPNLYTYVHLLRCYQGNIRSGNAYIINNTAMEKLRNLSLLMAFKFKSSKGLRPAVGMLPNSIEVFESVGWEKTFELVNTWKNNVPVVIQIYGAQNVISMGITRPGTMGAKLRQWAMNVLDSNDITY